MAKKMRPIKATEVVSPGDVILVVIQPGGKKKRWFQVHQADARNGRYACVESGCSDNELIVVRHNEIFELLKVGYANNLEYLANELLSCHEIIEHDCGVPSVIPDEDKMEKINEILGSIRDVLMAHERYYPKSGMTAKEEAEWQADERQVDEQKIENTEEGE